MVTAYQCFIFRSLLYKRVLYCELLTLWRYEVVNKHRTGDRGKATPPVCRYTYAGLPLKTAFMRLSPKVTGVGSRSAFHFKIEYRTPRSVQR